MERMPHSLPPVDAKMRKSSNDSKLTLKAAIRRIFRKPHRPGNPTIVITSPSSDHLITASPEEKVKRVEMTPQTVDPSPSTYSALEQEPSNPIEIPTDNQMGPSEQGSVAQNHPRQTKSTSNSECVLVPPEHRAPSIKTDATSSPRDPTVKSIPNVIIFGETGSGKSSVVNMFASPTSVPDVDIPTLANVSGEALGCTFDSRSYITSVNDQDVRLWDTAGLNEGEHGVVPAERALENLRDLIGKLTKEGVSLLVYCVRGPRYRDVWKINYDLFWGVFCQKKVPIVACVTGLENEGPTMESWWSENEGALKGVGLVVEGHACVTATRGKRMKNGNYMYEAEYEESKRALGELVGQHCMATPWRVEGDIWLPEIKAGLRQYSDVQDGGEESRERTEGGMLQNFREMLMRMGQLSVRG